MKLQAAVLKLVVFLMLTAGFPAAQAAVSAKIEPALLSAAQSAGQADFLIWFEEQADLSAADAEKTRADKGRVVMQTLRAAAERSQAPVLALLQVRGLEYRSFWIANAITARGSLADLQALAALSPVKQLYKIDNALSRQLPAGIARFVDTPRPAPRATAAVGSFDLAKALGDSVEPGVALIRAPEVWALGYKGQGVVVGDHDVGVMWDHPALKNQYRGWDGSAAHHDYNWRNAFGALDLFCTDPGVPCDSNGHGTHTTGTMVGWDGGANQVGVAPEAKWIACRSLLDPIVGVGTIPTYMDCMQWQLAPYPVDQPDAADPAMAPDVVNNSWGCLEGCIPPLLKSTNDAIKAAGIVQVVSAGNDGNGGVCGTVAFPLAVYESSFSVGASDVGDEMADFSSLGPVLTDLSLRTKPNVTAPGVDTRSAWSDGDYNTISGTSMAGPHVAGLVALIMSAEPRLIGRVDDIRALIERTANPNVKTSNTASTCGGTDAATIPNNIFGYGRIDAAAAVLARPQLAVQATAPATGASGGSYTAVFKLSQPASGKIDLSNALLKLTLPSGLSLKSSSEAPSTSEGQVLSFSHAALAPGEEWTLSLELSPAQIGSYSLLSSAEADQVSPLSAPTLVTAVGSGSGSGGGSAGGESGNYGGGALGWVSLLGLLAAGLRRRSRR